MPKQTSYARVLSGEIPILLDYDFDAYRAQVQGSGERRVRDPDRRHDLVVPYVMSLVKGAPHAANGKKVLDFVLSDEGQTIWADAYLRPVRASAMSQGSRRQIPAGQRLRARQDGRLRQDGRGAATRSASAT